MRPAIPPGRGNRGGRGARVLENEVDGGSAGQDLLQAHYDDGISPELFAEEQRRIRRERVAYETRQAELEADHGIMLSNLETALELTDRVDEAYRIADLTARRLLNQAIFERIWIEREQVSERRIASPLHEVLGGNDAEPGFIPDDPA